MQKQPKFIILEGTDRCGKTTLQLLLNKRFRYNHIILDRGPVGFQAYHEIFGRNPQTESYEDMEKSFKETNHLMIYLTCDTEEQLRRCYATNESIQDFDYHKSVYEKYFKKSSLNKVMINTTNMKPNEIIDYLIACNLL